VFSSAGSGIRTRRTALLGIALLWIAMGCSDSNHAELGEQRESVLNGGDDRKEVFELDEVTRSSVTSSSAALLYLNRLSWGPADAVSLNAVSAGVALGLCDDEPFANEPLAAFCSTVLIDDDLVLTAAHCVGRDAASATQVCQRLQVVFGFELFAPNSEPELHGDQVFGCRRVVTVGEAPADYAVLQLDRPVAAPLAAARFATESVELGDRLVVSSYGEGLPLKVELQAQVTGTSLGADSFVLASDTFAGSSGGGLFTTSLDLIGLFVSGASDWLQVNGCKRALRSVSPAEQGQPVAGVQDAICATGWRSERLCASQSDCSHAACSAACPGNCPPPRCGDALCERSERQSCARDCSPYANVPSSWLGDPALYRAPREPEPSSSRVLSPGGGCALSDRGQRNTHWWLLGLVIPILRRPFKGRRGGSAFLARSSGSNVDGCAPLRRSPLVSTRRVASYSKS